VTESNLRILLLDYLNDVSWGGPWNFETVGMLDSALKRLHSTNLNDEQKKEITRLADGVRRKLDQKTSKDIESEEDKEKKREEFLKSWSVDDSGFVNARGEVYFQGIGNLAEDILESALLEPEIKPEQLIMHDMNFANIGFSKEKVFLVDPVFVGLGSEYFDRTVAGVNILLGLGSGVKNDVYGLVMDRFITNKVALSKLIKYYVNSSFKRLDKSQDAWQKFHQDCAEVALKVFVKLSSTPFSRH